MVQVELSKIIIDEKHQDQIIVLKEKEGDRQFPIVMSNANWALARSRANVIPGVTLPFLNSKTTAKSLTCCPLLKRNSR